MAYVFAAKYTNLVALRNAQNCFLEMSFLDKIALNRQLLRLKDYYYWKLLGQENRQLPKEMDPTVKIDNNYSPTSYRSAN